MNSHTTSTHRSRDRGQIIVIFALGLVAMVAMVGLVLDGGAAYAHRRAEQNASDLAAMAGANAFLVNYDQPGTRTGAAVAAARQAAAQNGFTHGVGGVTVDVSVDTSAGASVKVDISAPHRNNFAAIVGMHTWTISTTATALTGFPDTVAGAGPMIFSIDAFDSNGNPLPQYANPSSPYAFGDTNNHAPTGPGDFAWTNYGTGNVNSNQVKDILEGSLVINKTLQFGEYIGQHNNGNHTTLFDNNNDCSHQGNVNKCLSGKDIPVPVVDSNGNFMGWATFHVVSASGGSDKKVYGYFVSPFVGQRLTVSGCSFDDCPRYLGTYALKLVN
jgi:Flp pilus assembly protein TadG